MLPAACGLRVRDSWHVFIIDGLIHDNETPGRPIDAPRKKRDCGWGCEYHITIITVNERERSNPKPWPAVIGGFESCGATALPPQRERHAPPGFEPSDPQPDHFAPCRPPPRGPAHRGVSPTV